MSDPEDFDYIEEERRAAAMLGVLMIAWVTVVFGLLVYVGVGR